MVAIEKDKLIIKLEHPAPDEFLNDLKTAIITTIQVQDSEALSSEEAHDINYTLLELLKHM